MAGHRRQIARGAGKRMVRAPVKNVLMSAVLGLGLLLTGQGPQAADTAAQALAPEKAAVPVP